MDDSQRIMAADTETGCIPPQSAIEKPGIEIMRDIVEGRIPPPPISKLMNFKLTDVDDGFAEFTGIPTFDHYNPAGVVHGGWAGTLLDSALGCCVATKLPAGTGYTTVEFKVNLVRPITRDTGKVICQARVTHFGRTIAVSEGSLKTGDGKLLALGTETCAIFPYKGGGS